MGGFAEIIASLEQADQQATLFINSLHSPASDAVWQFFSNRTVWIPLYLIVAFFLFQRLGIKKGLLAIFTIALTILAADQFSNLIKDYACRLRPCHNQSMLHSGLWMLEEKGGSYGFFSGHAANAMAFAICSYRCFNWHRHITFHVYGIVMGLWAVLVGLSRVFVGKHFLGDVIVGFAAGLVIAMIISGLAGLMARKPNRR